MSLARFDEANAEFRGLYLCAAGGASAVRRGARRGHSGHGRRTAGSKRYSVLILADVGPLAPSRGRSAGRLRRRRRAAGAHRAAPASTPTARAQLASHARDAHHEADDRSARSEVGLRHRACAGAGSPLLRAGLAGLRRALPGRGRSRTRRAGWPSCRRQPTGRPRSPMVTRRTARPATTSTGAGRVALMPWTVGRSYHELGLTTLRDIVVDARDRAARRRRAECTAELAEHVELTLQRRGDDLVVHLINLSGARRKNYGPHLSGRAAARCGSPALRPGHDRHGARRAAPPARPRARATTSSSSCPISSASRSC